MSTVVRRDYARPSAAEGPVPSSSAMAPVRLIQPSGETTVTMTAPELQPGLRGGRLSLGPGIDLASAPAALEARIGK
jgi:hypothetical protein